MTHAKSFLVAALTVAGLFLGAPARAEDSPPQGDAANGKRIFIAVGCYECHGRFGQGGLFNGPAPVLAQTQLPFDAFAAQLRTPANEMPPYAEPVMSDKQVADIFAFLHSLPGPRDAKEIAILNH